MVKPIKSISSFTVYSLRQRCEQVVKDTYSEVSIEDLEIPKSLKQSLAQCLNVEFKTYEQHMQGP